MLDSYVGITKIISRIQKNHNGGDGRRICGNSLGILREFSGNGGISQDHTCMAFLIVL